MNKNASIILAACIVAGATVSADADDRLILVGASYGKNVLAICESDGEVVWEHKTEGPQKGHAGHHDVHLLPNGNILFHDSWTKTQEITLGKEVVWEYDSATMNGNEGKRVDVHAFDRLDNGETVIVESRVGRIIHVDKNGKLVKQVPLGEGDRMKTRLMRILDNGHYLACAEKPGVVSEYDANGKVVWEYEIGTKVFGAIRLRNGNTLICSGSGNSVVEVTPKKQVVWEISKTIPGSKITLGWMTALQELPNGNIVAGNCHAGEKNPQIFEITKDKKVVWEFDEWDLVGNGLACWQILDAEQSAMVRKQLGLSPKNAQKNNVVTHTIDPLLQEKITCLNPNYYVSMPKGHKGEKAPLMIYLHGGGSKGVKMSKIDHCIPRLRSGIDKFDKGPCIIVVPQCLAKTEDGARGRWKPEDLNIFLENLMNTLPIDPNRVYLTGNSMGGYGSWAWGGSNPEHFAAIAPISGGIGSGGPGDDNPKIAALAKKLATVPVYAFAGEKDDVVPAERSKRMFAAIQEAGGTQAKLKVYPDAGHGAKGIVYKSQEFYDWMFSQTRK